MQVLFISISWYPLYFVIFSEFLWFFWQTFIFFRCKDGIGYLWLMFFTLVTIYFGYHLNPSLYKTLFKKFLILKTVNDKNCKTRTPSRLFNFDCKFACSFLVSTVWHGFLRLDTTLSQKGGWFQSLSSKLRLFVELFYENIASLSYFCHRLYYCQKEKDFGSPVQSNMIK